MLALESSRRSPRYGLRVPCVNLLLSSSVQWPGPLTPNGGSVPPRHLLALTCSVLRVHSRPRFDRGSLRPVNHKVCLLSSTVQDTAHISYQPSWAIAWVPPSPYNSVQ